MYSILLKCVQITIQLHVILNVLLQQLGSDNLSEKLTFCGRALKLVACVALVHEAADEVKITRL
jgi:hypothetical protein